MLRTDHLTQQTQERKPGKTGPAVFAFIYPRPPLKGFTIQMHQKQNPRDHSRVLLLPIRNGASPIASALGIRSGATPCGLIHPNRHPQLTPPKQDISTLP